MRAKKPIVIVGIGQMGGVFARGFLSADYPVYPVTLDMDMKNAAKEIPEPVFVLLAVPENVISSVLQDVPDVWKDKLGLLQNELLPYVWEEQGITYPTAMSVWFEKKKGQGIKVLLPTPVYGPNADIVKTGLGAIDIPCIILPNTNALLMELVKKCLYVFTINIAGIKVGGTTGKLWAGHRNLVKSIINEVLDILGFLSKETVDRDKLISFMADILPKVPDHNCHGRVAEDRLDRLLVHAKEAEINAAVLKSIKEHSCNK